MNNHLESAQESTRILGMFVAEQLSQRVKLDGCSPIEFSFDRTAPLVRRMESVARLGQVVPQQAEVEELELVFNRVQMEILPPATRQAAERNIQLESAPLKVDEGPCVGAAHAAHAAHELDSDDDLEPYDMSEDKVESKWEAPRYIRDVMDFLGNASSEEDACERVRLALESGESVIRQQLAREHGSLVDQLLKILIHLDDKYCIDNFCTLRLRTLIAVAASHPLESAAFLTAEFYRPNYSVSQRLDMLHVISAVARELSSQPSPSCQARMVDKARPSDDEESWREVVRQRIESNTRRFFPARRQNNNAAVVVDNGFTPVAGSFFFPLVEKVDCCLVYLKLIDEDYFILSTLLSTLAVIVGCTGPVSIVWRMARSLVDIVWLLRLHSQASVRESALVAYAQALMVFDRDMLTSHYALEVAEWKEWLVDTIDKDPSPQVRSWASHALSLLAHLLN